MMLEETQWNSREQERWDKPVTFFFLVQAKMSRKLKVVFVEVKLIEEMLKITLNVSSIYLSWNFQ